MTVNSYGLYAVITPGARRNQWSFKIYRDCYTKNSSGSDQIWDDTFVRTYGNASSQARAEKRARKRIAKMVDAYDMLARFESTVE